MGKYTIPNEFVAGTKASAEEVNENFIYLADVISNIGIAKYPFCVNYGNRNTDGKEDLFNYTNSSVTSKIGSSYSDFAYTLGNGTPASLTTSSTASVLPTKYASIIPILVSNTSETASCLATSEEDGHEAYQAFDKNEDSYWGSFVGVTSASLAISFRSRHVVEYYFIKTLAGCTCILEASNDEKLWTVLDQFSTADPTTITRKVEHTGNFKSYKLNVTVLDNSYQVKIAELDLFEKSSAGTLGISEKQIIYIGSDGLEIDANKYFRQENEPVGINKYSAVIPEMTSNLVPDGYQISASSYSAANAPYLATDRKEDSYWEATETVNDSWFQVQLPNSVNVKACKITLRPDEKAVDQALINGSLLASNNGITWTTLYIFNNEEWSHSSQSKYFYFTKNDTKFAFYRLSGQNQFASLGEFQLYTADSEGEYILGEAEVNDVWFRCVEPYGSFKYIGNNQWEEFSKVPAGECILDKNGVIQSVYTYPYNQNGYNINSLTTKENSGNIVTYDSYTSHLSPSGYAILPSKLIIQWGRANSSSGTILFPAAFPNAVFSVTANPNTSDSSAQCSVASLTKTGFKLNCSDSNTASADIQNYWIALGW